MPVCGQCGKENPDGPIYCGYCAAPLGADVKSSPIQSQAYNPLPPEPSVPIPPRIQPRTDVPPQDDKSGGIEWIPWNELSFGQKAGRAVVTILVLVLGLAVIRIALDLALHHGGESRQAASVSHAPLSTLDRKAGVQSLCKVFQIYGVPRTGADASAAAKSAQELFRLQGNESPARSAFILTTIAREFQSGKLNAQDCASAGEAIPTASSAGSAPSSAP